MAQLQVEFANIIIRSEKHELLDLFEELVYPAIADPTLERKYSKTSYFIESHARFETEWRNAKQVCLVARIVKSTQLEREQYYDENEGLVDDPQTLDTAPSGIFLLVLNSHKLVYFHETRFAPSLKQLGALLDTIIGKKHAQVIRQWKEELRGEGKSVTLAELHEEVPRPTVEVVPLASESDLSSFIDQFDILNQINVRLLRPNSEFHLDTFFEAAGQRRDLLGADVTAITQRRSGDEGMNADEAKKYVAAATKQGNARVRLSGTDINGDTLVGDNESFSIKTYLDRTYKSLRAAAVRLFREYSKLADDELIPVAPESEETTRRVAEVAENVQWQDTNSDGEHDDEPSGEA